MTCLGCIRGNPLTNGEHFTKNTYHYLQKCTNKSKQKNKKEVK
jgi:hypothetical protein